MTKKRDKVNFVLEAKRKIVASYEALPIFRESRSDALYNYIAVLEIEAFKAMLSEAPNEAMFQAHRYAVESSASAIPSIINLCPTQDDRILQVRRDGFEKAYQLFDFSYKKEQIEYCFRLVDKGQYRIYTPRKDRRITFGYASSAADESDTYLRSRELMSVLSGECVSIDKEGMQESTQALYEKLRTRVHSPELGICNYIYDEELLGAMKRVAEHFVQMIPMGIDAGISLRDISFAELHRFWGALGAISKTHTAAQNIASGGDPAKYPMKTVVLCKPRSQFNSLIARVSEIVPDKVGTIIDWYTYTPRVAERVVILQPFLPLHGDLLCLPSLFVNGNSFERNFFKLMHRHPDLLRHSSRVESYKEGIALRDLAKLFTHPRYRTADRVPVKGKTDADFVVYDSNSGFILIFQHKWLIAPDSVDESSANDQKLAGGIQQAVIARDAFRLNSSALRNALRLTKSDPITQIEAVVVCRGLEHTGFFELQSVPVIMEVAFQALVGNSHNLRDAWQVLVSRPDRIKAAENVMDTKGTIKLCAYEFVMPVLAY